MNQENDDINSKTANDTKKKNSGISCKGRSRCFGLKYTQGSNENYK